MLDLEPSRPLATVNDLHDLIDRIHSAAGPVPAIVVTPRFVAEAAAMLYRTRTLVATTIPINEYWTMQDAVEGGAGEIEISPSPETDTAVLIQLANRRTLKLALPDNCDAVDTVALWAGNGVRFVSLHFQHPAFADVLRTIHADRLAVGLKVKGCVSFADCTWVYEKIAEVIGEGWIWPGTLRISAGETLQNEIVARLRSATLSRPIGCGVREPSQSR